MSRSTSLSSLPFTPSMHAYSSPVISLSLSKVLTVIIGNIPAGYLAWLLAFHTHTLTGLCSLRNVCVCVWCCWHPAFTVFLPGTVTLKHSSCSCLGLALCPLITTRHTTASISRVHWPLQVHHALGVNTGDWVSFSGSSCLTVPQTVHTYSDDALLVHILIKSESAGDRVTRVLQVT